MVAGQAESDPSSQEALAKRLVRWSVSLLAPDVGGLAPPELRAEGLDPSKHPAPAPSTATLRPGEAGGRLRLAATVLDCDAVLSAVRRPDWTALADEHRREPFGRAQRRALIARPDCPDTLAGALLTPWDALVAGRLVARQQPVPRWAWQAALARVGEVRPSFVRHVLSDETVEELVLTTPRLDLLVRAVDGYDHNHEHQAQAFWECAGRLLRHRLGADRSAWVAVAAALPSHPGTFAGLFRRLTWRPTAASLAHADLRILAQAPDAVLADVIADLPEPLLAQMEHRDLRPRRARGHLTSVVLDRFAAVGIPPRRVFARWAYGARCTPTTRAWAHGLDPRMDTVNQSSAVYDVTLRRLLAAGAPHRAAVTGLVGALRACTGPIETEALLISSVGQDGAPPWRELVDAHLDTPLPRQLLCALAAREGFPGALARALPVDMLPLLAAQSPEAARAAVAALGAVHNPWGLLHRIRAAGVIDDEEILAVSRPAVEIVKYACTLDTRASATSSRDDLVDHYARLITTATRSAPAGFWLALLRLLPGFEGTLPELLTAASVRRPADDQQSG
jgi:hypothetical protein